MTCARRRYKSMRMVGRTRSGVDIASSETQDTTRSVQAAPAMVQVGRWQPSVGFLVEMKSPVNRSKPLHHNRSWFSSHPLNGYGRTFNRGALS